MLYLVNSSNIKIEEKVSINHDMDDRVSSFSLEITIYKIPNSLNWLLFDKIRNLGPLANLIKNNKVRYRLDSNMA